MSVPKVSIVIPCYNYGKYVVEAIDSCLQSTFQDIEIIVVNDGSTDPFTNDVLNRLDKPKTTVIQQHNKGLPAARNTGFRAARGEYVLPLDADDLIHPTLIEKAYWVMQKQPDVGFVSFWLKHFGDEDWIWMPPSFNLNKLLYENTVTVTSFVRKKAWEDANGYNEIMRHGYEDWDFWISIAEAGWQGAQIPEALFLYRKHGKTMINAAREKHDIIVDQIRKNHPSMYNSKDQSVVAEQIPFRFFTEKRIQKLKRWSYRILPRQVDHLLRNMVKNWLVSRARAQIQQDHINVETTFTENWTYAVKKLETNKIRLLFIMPWLEVGGADKVNLDLLSHLDRGKYEITIVTTLKSDNPWYEKFNDVTKDIFILPNYSINLDDYFTFITRLIESRSIQLIQISNSMEGYELLPRIKQDFSIPVVALVHNYVPEDPWDYARVSAEYDAHIDKYVAITNSLKSTMVDIIKLSDDKITIIENGVNTEVFYEDSNQQKIRIEFDIGRDKQIVTFIGRMRFEKEPLKYVRIAEHLARLDSEKLCVFLMVGDGDMFEDVQKQVRKSSYEDRFILAGARDDIADILRETSIVISPSQREGLPVVGLEAMATGIPVVASKVIGWIDLITDGENGFLIDFTDEKAFAEVAYNLVQDKDLYRKISITARNTIEKQYALRKFASKYEDLFSGLIRKSSYPMEQPSGLK